jgi:exoribonuclease R
LVRIHKVLGKALTLYGECERFLYEHGLNDFHYSQEETEVKEPLTLQSSNLHKKLERLVFTIDPPTSTDLDDALSIEKVG